MRTQILLVLALASASLLGACDGPGEEAAAANPILEEPSDVATAESRYDPAAFDTITWADEEEALARGAEIFTYACVQCHGPEGRGDGGYVQDGDTLHPPSFRAPGWRFAGNRQALLHQIYVGTDRRMPHWGLRRMRARDIDAVATYILEELVAAPGKTSG